MFKSELTFLSGGLPDDSQFDLLIGACGYESRARFVAESLAHRASRVVSYGYVENRTHSYDANYSILRELGAVYEAESSAAFEERFISDLGSIPGDERTAARIAIDISSFDRDRLAAIIRGIDLVAEVRELDVAFIYAMGSFDSHSESSEATILINAPLRGFEGWTSDPSLPVACVIGLGFENLVALAALETLEPARTVAFVAQSADSRFQTRVRRDNSALIGSDEVQVVPYGVDDPFYTLQQIESVVHTLRSSYRVALVPLGPKIFALLALLVAREYPDDVAVWRVSADQGMEPQDRLATGAMTSMRIKARPARPPVQGVPAAV